METEADPGADTALPERGGWWLDPREGLTFEAPDAFRLHLGGHLTTDYRAYDRRNVRDSELYLDRASLRADATLFERGELLLTVDLRGIDTREGFEESFVAFEAIPGALRITGGLLGLGVGIEEGFLKETLPFVGYASPALLSGRTDLGVAVDGEFGEGIFSYYVGVGGGEGFDSWGQRRGDPAVFGKLTVYPFRALDWTLDLGVYELPLLSGLFASAGGTYSFGYEGHLTLGNSLRNKLFDIGRIEGDSSAMWHFGYGIDLGPFRLTHEFVRGSIFDVTAPSGAKVDFENKISSWSASFAWMITGEHYDSRPYRTVRAGRHYRQARRQFPARPLFGGEEGQQGWGAFEVAIRYTNTEGDREFFDEGFTDYDLSSQEFRSFDVAVNWYPVRLVRFSFQLTRTLADQEPIAFDNGGRDTSFLVRGQFDF